MVVKDKVGRNRYIAFTATPSVGRGRLEDALRRQLVQLKLIEYDGTRGLVRCAHTEKDAAVQLLNRLRVGASEIRTKGTSGTIRKAREKYLRPRRRARRGEPLK